MLWVVGLLTSLLTAIYMFRLVFLAFHGERAPRTAHPARRTTARCTAHAHRHAAHGSRAICTTRRRRWRWR